MARTVVLDLASNHQLARDLVAGGVFVSETVDIGAECTLVLRNGDEQLELPALCVYVAGTGSGLQLVGCDADMKQRIIALASGMLGTTAADRPATEELDEDDEPATEELSALELAALGRPDQHGEADEPPTEELSAVEIAELGRSDGPGGESTGGEATDGDATDGDDADPERKIALNVHERLRGLALVQQLKVAQKGEVSERIVLERMYGKNVWEPLLRNPRITGPEVARIARMGALPRPLVEVIVANGGWLQIPEVRRALLSNPRLGTDQILRVLRLLPKHELKLAGIQTAYPPAVRDAAKRMLRDMGG